MSGLAVRRNPQQWRKVMATLMIDSQHQRHGQVLKAHFLAQGLSWDDEGRSTKELEVTQQTFDEVVKLYEAAANEGLSSGIYNLGLLLQEGNGVQRDFTGAVRLFKMAANFPIDDKMADWKKEGVLEAQYRLGLGYEFGLGVGQDDKKALHWYEMASTAGCARASRKLGDIYLEGLLGVSKDEDMALFFWEHAAAQGDTVAQTSAPMHLLTRPSTLLTSEFLTPSLISHCVFRFSQALTISLFDGTRSMMLNRKQYFEFALANVLYKLVQTQSNSKDKETEESEHREPEGVSWNRTAFINHTLRTIHLLELAQTPGFQQKFEATPDWKRPFQFTDRLVCASNSCVVGLATVKELNKLYRQCLINANQHCIDIEYPPDLRTMTGVVPATLAREAQLVSLILACFANSIRGVGAAFFHDSPTQELIHRIIGTVFFSHPATCEAQTCKESINYTNASLIFAYAAALKGVSWEEILTKIDPKKSNALTEPFLNVSAAAVQGSLVKFEVAAGYIERSLKKVTDPRHFHLNFRSCDLLFVQGLLCKAVGLTRGVNSANRKKIKEAMAIFQEFLSICPKDEPRRAEAHYQLALCTLYLEKMKVKGQVKSSAKDILDKFMPHFTQGEEAEQELPWKEFPLPDKPAVKLLVQRKIQELEALVKKIPGQNLTSDLKTEFGKSESLCFGRLVDPLFRFPISSFPLKKRESRRIKVITEFRRVLKIIVECGLESSPSSTNQDSHLRSMPPSLWSAEDVYFPSIIQGYYEVVEPVAHVQLEGPKVEAILTCTVVQDDIGAVFNLRIITTSQRSEDVFGKLGWLKMGARIIVHQPLLRPDVDGGTSLFVKDAEAQIFHLPSTFKQQGLEEGELEVARKCGFCEKFGGTLQCCSKCQVVYYCGKECQKADWNELKHKWICPYLDKSV